MRVLLVASTFPCSDNDRAPAFVKDLVVALKREQPELEVAVLAPQYLDETPPLTRHEDFDEYRFAYFLPRGLQRLAGRGIVPAIEKSPAMVLLVPFLFLFELLSMLALVRRLRPDYLYAHWFTPQGVNAAIVSMLTGVPYVLTSHANDVRIWKKVPVLGRAVVRRLLPRASRITVVSTMTLEKMKGFFSAPEWSELADRVEIIPMGVDIKTLGEGSAPPDELKRRYGYEGLRLVYFIGRLASKKGVSDLLDAMAKVEARDLKLVIAGDGPLRESLEAQAAQLGLDDRVEFIGYVSGQAKLDYLWMSDVVVVPSIETPSGDTEGFPVVIMEALAAGKPCIASDATGADSVLVDGGNGFLVPQQRADVLAEKLQHVLGLDDSSLQEIATQARKAATALDWGVIARRHYDFLFKPR